LTEFLAPAQSPEELGRLGGYRVLKVLGQGGMGVVFLAEDPRLQRQVALKAMLPGVAATPSARQRFLREARAAAALKHDHIITIYQVDEDRGVPFAAMELLEGESLEDRLHRAEGKALPVAEVVRIAREMAEGLSAAHEKGLVHRDVKPANVWLEGKRGRVKVLDFGLARGADEQAHLTQTGAIVGTPAYMAPEQARGEKVDARADLFSLGCVLYRMATGQPAFRGSDTIATLMAVCSEDPDPPLEANPELPRRLAELIGRLLTKDPARRPKSAQAVAQALQATQGESTVLLPARRSKRKAEPPQPAEGGKRGLVVGAVAATLLGVGLSVGGWAVFRKRPSDKAVVNPRQEPKDKPSLDLLDLERIPPHERLPGLPAETVAVVEDQGNLVDALAFSPDGTTLAVGGHSRIIRLYDVGRAKPVLRDELRGHTSTVAGLGFSPDGKTLASASHDNTARLWDVSGQTGRLTKLITDYRTWVWSVRFLDGNTLAVGSAEPRVALWDVRGEPAHQASFSPPPPARKVGCVRLALTRDRKTLAAGCQDGKVYVWPVRGDKLAKPEILTAHLNSVRGLDFSPDGKTFVTGSFDRTVCVWKREGGKWRRHAVLPDHANGVMRVAFAPDGKTFVSADNEVILWDAKSLKKLRTWRFAHPPWALAFAPDSRHLAVDSGMGTVYLLRLTRPHVAPPAGGGLSGFTPLFNGKDLRGWKAVGGTLTSWKVDRGQKMLSAVGKPPSWLMTAKQHDDFELLLEYRLGRGGNSGVALRAPLTGRPHIDGMEIQIADDGFFRGKHKWYGANKHTGGIFNVMAPQRRNAGQSLNVWHPLRVVARGRRLRIDIDTVPVLYTDLDKLKHKANQFPGLVRRAGHIGLQRHDGRVDFRNVFVRVLPPLP
jgi:serine/threonine protein kinase